jgi:hypothetical protein
VTKDGGLPPAPTLTVSGERELTQELERIIDTLNKGAAVDWERRCVVALDQACLIASVGRLGSTGAMPVQHWLSKPAVLNPCLRLQTHMPAKSSL